MRSLQKGGVLLMSLNKAPILCSYLNQRFSKFRHLDLFFLLCRIISNNMSQPYIVAFEGSFGSGKSTVISILAKKLGNEQCAVFVDPLERWNDFSSDLKCKDQIIRWGNALSPFDLLQQFLEHPSFEAFHMLLEQVTNAARNLVLASKQKDKKFVLVERTALSVLNCLGTTLACHLNTRQKQMLDRVKETMDDIAPKPDMYFFLDACPKRLKARIDTRGWPWQENVSEKVLEELNMRYDNLRSILLEEGATTIAHIDTTFRTKEVTSDIVIRFIQQAMQKKLDLATRNYSGPNNSLAVISVSDSTAAVAGTDNVDDDADTIDESDW